MSTTAPPSTLLSGALQRPRLSKRASSSASFYGQLKNLHSPAPLPTPEEETIIDASGKPVRIRNSGIVHSVTSAPNGGPFGAQKLVATLVYNLHPAAAVDVSDTENGDLPPREDCGDYVTDLAIFEFVQLIDRLVVPYKPTHTTTKILDSFPSPLESPDSYASEGESELQPRVVEIKLRMPSLLQLEDLRRHEALYAFERKWNLSVVLQRNSVFRRHKRLAVFDMDSTLIQQEVIDVLASYIGVEAEVSAITARAMNGELDFTDSLRERVKLLKGVPATVWEELKGGGKITFTPGARALCNALKKLGYKLAVFSGGFLPLADWVKQELGLDYAFANQLVVSLDGKELTGELVPGAEIVNAERKEELLVEIAAKEGIALEQTIAVGDGANDLKMMKRAGLGVAFNAKPHVQTEAPCKINCESLQDVLFVLGFTRGELEELLH